MSTDWFLSAYSSWVGPARASNPELCGLDTGVAEIRHISRKQDQEMEPGLQQGSGFGVWVFTGSNWLTVRGA